jgi:hypothetical protein
MDQLEKLNAICYWLINRLLDTEAETMTITQTAVTKDKVVVGDFEIIVRRIK